MPCADHLCNSAELLSPSVSQSNRKPVVLGPNLAPCAIWMHTEMMMVQRTQLNTKGVTTQLLPCVVTWVALLAFVGIMPACASEFSEIVAGEVIVKFEQSSIYGHELDNAEGEKGLSIKSLPDFDQLAAGFALPLTAEKITSGGELVVTLKSEQIVDSLLTRIHNDQTVAHAEMVTRKGPLGSSDVQEILVTFKPDTSVGRALAESKSHGQEVATHEALASLERLFPARLTGYLRTDGRLAVNVDFHDAIERVAARLTEMEGVEYAQPNFLLEPQ